ncbi:MULTISPECIES: hypothetical protein [unclassified Agromyces]|uniref:hypothetical protein n=1 Tax=unclassified Agromyces TaxID=2639701 RepID=UPI003015065D
MPVFPRRHPDRTAPAVAARDPRGRRSSREVTATADSAERGPGEGAIAGYRLVRRLSAGERADVYLAVVDGARRPMAEGEEVAPASPLVVMRVYGPEADDDAITTEIEAMEADVTGTLPELLDVANVGDGRACLVVERVTGRPLSEILAAGGLVPGQVVTALAPIVVAVQGLGDRGFVHRRLAASDIRIEDSGRPRLLGLGALCRLDAMATARDRVAATREGHAAMLRLTEDVVAACTDRAAFDGLLRIVRAAVGARPFRRAEADIERALFAVAPALPIVMPADHVRASATPIRMSVDRIGAEPHGLDAQCVEPEADTMRDARLGRWGALAQLPTAAIDELATALDTDPRVRVMRRLAAWAARRRPALLTGGLVGAAALVALLSAVPPSSAEDATAADSVTRSSVEEAGGPGSAADSTPRSDDARAPERVPDLGALPDDPVAAAAALLEIRQTCLASRDAECVLAVAQPGSPIAARDGATIQAGEEPTPGEADLAAITVAADLGDAVVLTVPWAEAGREPASLLMMRSEAGWRLREWFD